MNGRPGVPWWTGFVAFCANMLALTGLDVAGAITVDNELLGATVASLLVAAGVYGKAKLDELRAQN